MAELLIQWERDIARLKNSSGSAESVKVREFIADMNQITENTAAIKFNARERVVGGIIPLPVSANDRKNEN